MNGRPRAGLVVLAALLLATTGALSAASTASADSGPTLSLDIHALGVGDTVRVSSSGWDPGTTVSFSTTPPDSPPTIVDAAADGAGAVADFQISVTGSAFAAGSTTTWTLTASGTAGGVGATAQDSASVKGPTDPEPGDYHFTAPAADTTTTLRATSTTSTTLTWTRTAGATEYSLSITTYRAIQAGGVCPAAISSYTGLAPVSVPGVSNSSIATGLAKGYC